MIGSDLENDTYEATKDIKEMMKAISSRNNQSKINLVLETGGGGGKKRH